MNSVSVTLNTISDLKSSIQIENEHPCNIYLDACAVHFIRTIKTV